MAWQNSKRAPSDYLHPAKRQRVLVRHGRVCHLCGHGGAEQVDHVVPWAEWPRNSPTSVHDESNLRPAHGEPCPTCGRACHQDKSKQESKAGRQRAALRGKRTPEAHPGTLSPQGGAPPSSGGSPRWG